jgi:hypothetical protein
MSYFSCMNHSPLLVHAFDIYFLIQVFIRSVSKTAETLVNNLPVKDQRQLCDGDTIMIGQRAFIYYSDFASIKSKGPSSVSNKSMFSYKLMACLILILSIHRRQNRKDRHVLHSKMPTAGK